MKKFIAIILCVCICLSSTAFAFAEAWTSQEAYNVTNDVSDIQEDINNLTDYFYDFWATANGSNAATLYSWQDFMYEFWRLSEFLIPRGSYAGQTNLWQIIEGTLPNILTYVSSWMSTNTSLLNTNNNYLDFIRKAQGNILNTFGGTRYSISSIYNSAHTGLFSFDGNNTTSSYYTTNSVGANGAINNYGTYWNSGTALGNIALLLKYTNDNLVKSYSYRWAAELTDYTGQMGIWDSQGDTLTQESWSPTSAINGLYKYLAYTQRDVARLTYVLASDEEIQAREEARANQTEVFDNFIDPSGSGAASTSDFSNVSDLSSGFKNNISTDASVSGIWNIFNSNNFGWFSQETADQLDTSNSSTRTLKSSGSYPTPLLDQQTEDILKYIGGENND